MIKHKSEVINKFSNTLSRRCSFLTKMKVEVLGFDEMKELYDTKPNFPEVWRE